MHHSAGLLRIPVFALHRNSTDLRPPAPRFRGTLELRSSSVLFFEYGSCSPLVAFGQSRYLPHGFGKAVCAALPPTRKSWPKGVARITLSGDPPRSSHIRFELVGTNDLTSNRVNRHKYKHLLLKAISYPHLRRVGSLYCADLNCAYCSSRCSREPTKRVKIVTPAAKRPILIDGRNEAEVPEPVTGKVRELRARD